MKKNRMLRLAYGLLVAVVLSTCVISGTFAKYVTANYADDSARVAKFGVEIVGSGDMFAQEYAADEEGFDGVSVKSEEKVVAPGTSGKLTGFTLNGTPEVAVRVSYEAEVDLGDGWIALGNYYCPLEVSVNNEVIKGINYENIEEFEADIKEAIDGYSKDYVPGTDLAQKNDADGTDGDDLDISWSWPFEADESSDAMVKYLKDANDTALGNLAANGDAATISVSVTCRVTQID